MRCMARCTCTFSDSRLLADELRLEVDLTNEKDDGAQGCVELTRLDVVTERKEFERNNEADAVGPPECELEDETDLDDRMDPDDRAGENPLLHVLYDRLPDPTDETDTTEALEEDLSRNRRSGEGLRGSKEARFDRILWTGERRLSWEGGRETESRLYPNFFAMTRACSVPIF